MKLNAIINRYLFSEMIPMFVINLLLFTLIFLMAKILDITDLIINHRVSVSSVLCMLIYFVPSFLVFVIPMSIMMGVLLAFLRLSNDNEIIALKAGGVSIYRLLPPVLAFCLIGFLMTGFMSMYGSPWGRLSFKDLLFETVRSNIDIGLKERTFNNSFKEVMLYVNKINTRDKTLTDVFVEDRRTSGMVSTVVAPRGEFFSDPERFVFQLRLHNGVINQLSRDSKSVHSVKFDTYDFYLDLARVLSPTRDSRKGRKEMGLAELRRSLNGATKKDVDYYLALMEYHKKFSIPFACLVLGFIAVPLGVQSKSAKRSFGIILGLLFFLIYYTLLSVGWVLGEPGICPPIIGMWLPNLVIGSIAAYLLFMTANERPVKTVVICLRVFQWFKSVGKGRRPASCR